MKTYTLKLKTTSTVDYNLYDGTTLVSDTDLGTLFGSAGEAYFVFDFNSLTPTNTTALNILDSNDTAVIANTGLTGIAENKNFKGAWSASATAFDSFVALTGVAMDEAQLGTLVGMVKNAGPGKAKVLTTADYNANSSNWNDTNPANFNCIALWRLPSGMYVGEGNLNARAVRNKNDFLVGSTIAFVKQEVDNNDRGMVAIFNGSDNVTTTNALFYSIYNDGYSYNQTPFPTKLQNNLTTSGANFALDARQGKVLADRIGDLSTLTTTDKTSAVAAINEIVAGGGGGGMTELPASGYNWPSDSPDGIALWALNPGVYYLGTGAKAYYSASGSSTTTSDIFIVGEASNGLVQIIMASTTNSDFKRFNINTTTGSISGSGSLITNIVQATGTSQTDAMSQKAVTDMIYPGNTSSSIYIVKNFSGFTNRTNTVVIGTGNQAAGFINNVTIVGIESKVGGQMSTALGSSAYAAENSVALGAGAYAPTQGTVSIGSYNINNGSPSTYGYNSTQYRLLTDLYDGQSAHDAATKGQLDATESYSTTEVATGGTWVDDKAIYKKTISFGALPDSSTKTVAHGITDLYRVVKFEGIGYRSTDGHNFPIPLAFSGNDTIMPFVDSTNISIQTGAGRSSIDEVYITLYYTKSS